MTDDTQDVPAGSTGEYVPEETSTEETTTTDATATAETTEDTGAQGDQAPAEDSATDTASESEGGDPDASRTDFAKAGLKAGDQCTCPDGRIGTVHRFDAGLICLPNQG